MLYLAKFPSRGGVVATTLMALFTTMVGCAPRADSVSAQLQQLQREVRGLRADNLMMKDRLETLEEEGETAAGAMLAARHNDDEGAPAASDAAGDRPALAVVRLTPETEMPIADVTRKPAVGSQLTAEPLEIVGDARGVKQQKKTTTGANSRPAPSFQR